MTVRSLDFLDLPFLARNRRNVLPLDSARAVTHGNPLGAMALLSYLNPRHHIYTAVSSEDGLTLMGQVTHQDDQTFARLSFLVPAENLGRPSAALIDYLVKQVGEWGALHLLAEVDEHSPAFKEFRQTGFSMYAWQRVWKLAGRSSKGIRSTWQMAEESDLPAIQAFYSQIVPPLLQTVEPLPRRSEGLVCRADSGLQAYAALNYGPVGIWVQPLIHPDASGVPDVLTALLRDLPGRAGRPVYVCVRSYQTWLDSVFEELDASASPQQAVMVKHLVVMKQAEQVAPARAEKVWAKPATPVARVAKTADNEKSSP